MWWQEFHFLRPWFLLGLIIPLFISFKIWKSGKIQSSWAEVCDENLLQYLLIKGQDSQRKQPIILAIIITIFMIFAISGPTWSKKNNPALMVNNPVMFVLNMSSDMSAQDVSPNRLDRAKLIIREMTQTLKGTETGLIIYSHEPFMITPLAEDAALVENILPSVTYDIMPVNGDRLDRAIDMAVERMQKSGYYHGNIVVLAGDIGEQFDAANKSAEAAKDKGFSVNVIKLNAKGNNKLASVAQKGGGILLNYNQNIMPLAEKINNALAKELKQSENMQVTWEDAGYYLFWLPALLLLYYFRRGVLGVIILLIWSNTASANWFLNDNQEAMRLFEAKQYEQAAQKFKDPHWQGAAAYKSGNYKQALKQFNQEQGLDAIYNQGNALAKAGKIEEAIAKYEEVLAQDEHFEDARYNLEYLKRQQQKQQNQNQQQQENKQNKNQDQKNNQNSESQKQQDQNQQQQQEQQKKDNKSEQNPQQKEDSSQQEQSDNNQDSKQQENKETSSENNKEDQSQSSQDNSTESDQSEENNDKQDQNQPNQDQDQSSDAGDQSNQDQSNDKSDEQDNNKSPASSEQSDENTGDKQQNTTAAFSEQEGDKEAETMQAQIGENENPEEREKYRARMQRFREIPEDKGGLLREFIKKEYNRRRYKD